MLGAPPFSAPANPPATVLEVLVGGAEDSSPRAALVRSARRARPSLTVITGGKAHLRDEAGQASVEFVALLPLLVLIVAVAWQAALAGQAVWEARVAARAAARANAIGADAAAAARAHLPDGHERGLRVRAGDDGDVRVSIRLPGVLGVARLGHVTATSHFRPQG